MVTGHFREATLASSGEVILDVRDLQTHFVTRRGVGKAVDGVSFEIRRGETLGLVGESGSGKSMVCLSILRLHPSPASRIVAGQVLFRGRDLLRLPQEELRHERGRHIAMILQDPMTALNPVFTVGEQVAEPLRLHQRLRGAVLKERAAALLRSLQIAAPERRLKSYPHELSGGMRQRVVAAIALSCEPELVIADEPTTSLDATVQAAFLTLLRERQRHSATALLFVTHDLGVVEQMCDRVAVMYAGKIVETADVQTILHTPAHPYTRALVRSVPRIEARPERLASIPGQIPSIYQLPVGCAFAARCPDVYSRCLEAAPPATTVAKHHTASCWRL